MTTMTAPAAPAPSATSHWWTSLGGDPPLRPPLVGDREADVAIVGAGYTGLWTAYELKRARPQLEVVVLEARFAGFGASGRNGGWLQGLLAGSRERYAARAGRDAVLRAQRAMQATVGEVARVAAEEEIDCDLVHAGSLTVATTAPQEARLREALADDRRWGLGEEDVRPLDAAELAARVRVAGARAALFSPHCARVHPAKLVRGLAAAAERRGVRIFEASPVTAIAAGRAETARGTVRARTVIRATEGYTARLPGARRALVPLNSSMIATEPLGEAVWEQLGWEGAETLLHDAHLYTYLQRTADGRIAIGGRGVPYRFGSSSATGAVDRRTVRELHERLAQLFPAVRDAGVAGAWAGVLGVARDWTPSVGLDPATGLGWAGGYVGEGVAAANLAGRTLRDLVLGEDTELTRLPWVGWRSPRWEPEPLRFAGIRAVYALYRAADRVEDRTGRPSPLARLAALVAGR
jgi:glycine/D-amino acid oxidase-like deaminating enzyme